MKAATIMSFDGAEKGFLADSQEMSDMRGGQKGQRPPPPRATALPSQVPGMIELPLGVSGIPSARPYFVTDAENGIRYPQPCCPGYNPGPSVPLHWYDGGQGWVTKYFYDTARRDPAKYEPGRFRCQAQLPNGQLCRHVIVEDDCCKGNCLWTGYARAPFKMQGHLAEAHGLKPPRLRSWSSGLFETEGCCESYLCAPCQGSRQMMALAGWEDELHWGWCLFFTFVGFRCIGSGRNQILIWIPPWIYVAMLTRLRLVRLNNIDEGVCTSCCAAIMCSLCSMAQTYRELAASGVWSGSSLGLERPANYASVGMSSPPLNSLRML